MPDKEADVSPPDQVQRTNKVLRTLIATTLESDFLVRKLGWNHFLMGIVFLGFLMVIIIRLDGGAHECIVSKNTKLPSNQGRFDEANISEFFKIYIFDLHIHNEREREREAAADARDPTSEVRFCWYHIS